MSSDYSYLCATTTHVAASVIRIVDHGISPLGDPVHHLVGFVGVDLTLRQDVDR